MFYKSLFTVIIQRCRNKTVFLKICLENLFNIKVIGYYSRDKKQLSYHKCYGLSRRVVRALHAAKSTCHDMQIKVKGIPLVSTHWLDVDNCVNGP